MGGAGSMGSAGSMGGQQQQQQTVNSQAFNSLMQADRGLNRQEGPTYSEYGSAFGVSGGAGAYGGAQNSFGGGQSGAQQSFGGGQYGAQQSFGGGQSYSNQTSTGLGSGFNSQAFNSLMQADRGLNRQEGPTYAEYGNAFGVSGGAGSYGGAQNSAGGGYGAQQSFGGGQYGAQNSFGGSQGSYSNQTSTGLGSGNSQAFNSLMQADRGLNRQEGPTYAEYGSAFGVSGGAGSYGAQNSFGGGQYGAQNSFGGGQYGAQNSFGGGQSGAQQSFGGGQYGAQQSFGGGQSYSNQTSTGLGSGFNSQAFNSLMQADRGLNRQEGPTYSEYGSAFGVSGGAGANASNSFGGSQQS